MWCRSTATPATLCEPQMDSAPPAAHPLWCRGSATPATLCEPETDSAPTPSSPPLVSRKYHACHALRARNG
eukprot:5536824-Pyramimonas_sp.AAC.1